MGSKGEEGDARLAAHNTTMCIGDDWGFLDGDVAKSRKLNAGKFCALLLLLVVCCCCCCCSFPPVSVSVLMLFPPSINPSHRPCSSRITSQNTDSHEVGGWEVSESLL